MSVSLAETGHRPWPLPAGNWVMAQSWHDLLFAHWAVDRGLLRRHIPADLEMDVYQGQAWLGVVPFRMSGVRLRGMPAIPWLSAFPELNVRTYVVANGKPGVWFFSLDAASRTAVAIARAWFHLPYFHARMSCEEKEGWIEYRCERIHPGASRAALSGRYRAIGQVFTAPAGSLEYFLTERYCLYTIDRNGQVIRGEIHHAPWLLQEAKAELLSNTMAQGAGIHLPQNEPLLHFATRQDVVVWPPRRLERSSRL